MSSYSYIALLINREQGAQSNEKKNGYRERMVKQSKRHKRFNFSYTLIVLIVALVLLVFAIRVKVEPVEAMPSSGNDYIRSTYLGNITLNKHFRQMELNEVFKGLKQPLQQSDFSTASLLVSHFSNDPKTNIKKNIENIMFLKKKMLKVSI